jgi:hypothetical protein
MTIKLENLGKRACIGTAFAIMIDGSTVGTAYRNDSGKRRGMYSFQDFTGSRARLLVHAEKLAEALRIERAADLHAYEGSLN